MGGGCGESEWRECCCTTASRLLSNHHRRSTTPKGDWYATRDEVPDEWTTCAPTLFPPPPEVASDQLHLERCVRVNPHMQVCDRGCTAALIARVTCEQGGGVSVCACVRVCVGERVPPSRGGVEQRVRKTEGLESAWLMCGRYQLAPTTQPSEFCDFVQNTGGFFIAAIRKTRTFKLRPIKAHAQEKAEAALVDSDGEDEAVADADAAVATSTADVADMDAVSTAPATSPAPTPSEETAAEAPAVITEAAQAGGGAPVGGAAAEESAAKPKKGGGKKKGGGGGGDDEFDELPFKSVNDTGHFDLEKTVEFFGLDPDRFGGGGVGNGAGGACLCSVSNPLSCSSHQFWFVFVVCFDLQLSAEAAVLAGLSRQARVLHGRDGAHPARRRRPPPSQGGGFVSI